MKLGDLFDVQPSTGPVTSHSAKPPSRPSLSQVPGVTIADVLKVFPGSKVIAIDRPLRCQHCEGETVPKWRRGGRIVLVKEPDGTRRWGCHNCGRAVTSEERKDGGKRRKYKHE